MDARVMPVEETLLLHLEMADEANPCLPWFYRAPSHSNLADPPSRGRRDELGFLLIVVVDSVTFFLSDQTLASTQRSRESRGVIRVHQLYARVIWQLSV